MSGEGGHRAPCSNGAARTSVNRDFNTAQFNRPSTGSTTTRHLDRSTNDGRVYDLQTGYLGRAVPPFAADASVSGAAIESVLHTLPPSAPIRCVNTLNVAPCASVWYQPHFRSTWPASVASDSSRH